MTGSALAAWPWAVVVARWWYCMPVSLSRSPTRNANVPVAPWLIFEIEIDPAGMNRLKKVQTLACPLVTVTVTEPWNACRSPLQLTDTALQCPASESGAFSRIL